MISQPSKVLVVCARRYNGHELWTLLGVLQARGHQFEVVSTNLLVRDELTMQPNQLDRLVYDVPPDTAPNQFDGICVVSGNMADTEAYWTDPHVQAILVGFKNANKLTAAICCSVPTLAPIAFGVKVSYFPLLRSKKRLQDHGAILQTVSLTVDGKFATAENQMLTEMWGEEIANILENKPPQFTFQESGFMPKGRERRMSKDVRAAINQAKAERKQAENNEEK